MAGPSSLRSFLYIGLALFPFASGCAHMTAGTFTEETRATLGTVGVAGPRESPAGTLDVPTRGRADGAAKGAGVAVFAGLYAGAQSGHPFGLLFGGAVGIALTPVGAVIGAATALPAEKAGVLETMVRDAAGALPIQEILRDTVFEEARNGGGRRTLLLSGTGPRSIGERADYASLAEMGVDTVLEVGVDEVALYSIAWGGDPLSLLVKARAMLVSVRDGSVLLELPIRHVGVPRPQDRWTGGMASLFRAELDEACRVLADRIVLEVFLLYIPPGKPIGSQARRSAAGAGDPGGAVPGAAPPGTEPPW